MSELKTLKDLGFDKPLRIDGKDIVDKNGVPYTLWAFYLLIQQEAIKYIFDLRKYIKKTTNDLDGAISREIMGRTILWIKHFFNIEESDLK